MDEVSLALVADAWSRTYRSRALTYASGGGAVVSLNGVRLLADEVVADWPAERRLPLAGDAPAAQALDAALQGIASRYGTRTSQVVAMQLEYPRR
jgi:hypothetical protein